MLVKLRPSTREHAPLDYLSRRPWHAQVVESLRICWLSSAPDCSIKHILTNRMQFFVLSG